MPRRIAVTGTRGKSGVTRLIASGLRASGLRVLAKTTGSKPMLILPDGTEREIVRTGPAAVREQVRLVRAAAAVRADVLVAEMMSIGAECLAAESAGILRPDTVVVTNVRLDHLDEMGRDKPAIARTLAAAVPRGADVFVPAEEVFPALEEAAVRTGSRLRAVPAPAAVSPVLLPLGEFEPNRRLARAVLASWGLDDGTIERGLAAASPDPGGLGIWRGLFGEPARPAVCINLFAANEPESSAAALRQVLDRVPPGGRPLVGLVSLREDRGDRTLQWVRAAGDGFFRAFSSVLFLGPPARAALRRLRRLRLQARPAIGLARGRTPAEVMGRLLSAVPGEPIVVGLGNFVGPGEALVEYWRGRGSAHGG